MLEKRSEQQELNELYEQVQQHFGNLAKVQKNANAVSFTQKIADGFSIHVVIFPGGEVQIEDEWEKENDETKRAKFVRIFQEHSAILKRRFIQMGVYRSPQGEHYGAKYGFHGFNVGRLATNIPKFEIPTLKNIHCECVDKIKDLLSEVA